MTSPRAVPIVLDVMRWSPPAQTGALIIVFVVVFQGLGHRALEPADPASAAFTTGVGWITWKSVAAAATVVLAALFCYGVYVLVVARFHDLSASRGRRALYALMATLPIVAVIVLIQTTGGGTPRSLPVASFPARTHAVVYTGLVAAIPWLAAAWHVQDGCRRLGDDTGQRPADLDSEFRRLQDLWAGINTIVGVFACGVVAALITAGALRFAFLSAFPGCGNAAAPTDQPGGCTERFPATNVLLFGAAFAVFLLAVTVPMVVTWRARAIVWIDAARPLPDAGIPDQGWVDDRARLQTLLHLDTPVLRNPLALLTIFLPLVTSLLAAFLPQLAA